MRRCSELRVLLIFIGSNLIFIRLIPITFSFSELTGMRGRPRGVLTHELVRADPCGIRATWAQWETFPLNHHSPHSLLGPWVSLPGSPSVCKAGVVKGVA